jgi:hypothetical protein
MDFSALPPELVGQMPIVAVLLWIGVQSRKEMVAAITRLTERIDQVRLEVRALRVDLGRTDDLDDDLPPVAPAPPPPAPIAIGRGDLRR